MFGWFQNKSTRAFVSTTTNNTATSRKRRSPQQPQQPLPSCKLYDLCIDRDWQAVNDHAKQHPIDGSYQDFHGHDGGATPHPFVIISRWVYGKCGRVMGGIM